ncbi:MAG: hypothetical protein Q4F18_09765 [Clostridia bacterium]|nr:hypothetical protein [Clostridia bacterium]
MENKRKRFRLPDGMVIEEHVCSHYTCRYCGAKASYCNYVGDICLQAFAPHVGSCGAYISDERYSGYINECKTCKYLAENGGCAL